MARPQSAMVINIFSWDSVLDLNPKLRQTQVLTGHLRRL